MTLDNDDEIAKAISESSLDGLSDDGLKKLVGRFDEIPPDVQLRLMKTNPELQKLALEAVSAVEENLKATLASNDASTQQAFAALADIREVIKGELQKENVTDERWRFLIDKLTENGQMAMAKDTENKQFLDQQAKAERFSKAMTLAMPYVETVVQIGVRILISRGRI